MDKEKIAIEVDETLNRFIQLMTSVDEDVINVVPFADSWTAGQLAQHVFLVGSTFADKLYGPVEISTRNFNEKSANIIAVLSNFDVVYDAPASVVPPSINYDKEDLINNLMHIRSALKNGANTLDLTLTCHQFDVRGFGILTRLEALNFAIYHT